MIVFYLNKVQLIIIKIILDNQLMKIKYKFKDQLIIEANNLQLKI